MSNQDSPIPPAPAEVCERLKSALEYLKGREMLCMNERRQMEIADMVMGLTAALLLIEQGEKERERVDWLLEKSISINVSESGPGYGFAYTRLFPSRQAIDAARAQPTTESK